MAHPIIHQEEKFFEKIFQFEKYSCRSVSKNELRDGRNLPNIVKTSNHIRDVSWAMYASYFGQLEFSLLNILNKSQANIIETNVNIRFYVDALDNNLIFFIQLDSTRISIFWLNFVTVFWLKLPLLTALSVLMI